MATKPATRPPGVAGQARDWPPPQGRWTYPDYARLPDNGMRYEVIEGDLFMNPAPRPKHQKVSLNLAVALHQFVKQHNLGDVYEAPIDVILPNLASTVQPDLLFIAGNRLDIVKEEFIEGVPDLIIEVLSPGNPDYDRRTKFQLYARAGVREYWIIDPDACTIDIFVLRGQAYAPLGGFSSGDKTRSEVLADFRLRVAEIC